MMERQSGLVAAQIVLQADVKRENVWDLILFGFSVAVSRRVTLRRLCFPLHNYPKKF